MQITLFEPEIPQNTGNIARLCAALDVPLNLIGPLGFSLEDRYLKRAGLDYWPHVRLKVWPSFDAYWRQNGHLRHIMTSSRSGLAAHRFNFEPEDALLFGPETRGLPPEVLEYSALRVRIPIRGAVRSLNLSTAAGIILHQAMAACGLLEDI